MSPQNIAGYALQEALISHHAHVERWRALSPQGPAEIFIMPKINAQSISATPQWAPFASFSVHNFGNKAAIVVPGILVENLPSLRRRLGPGPAVGFAWHISTHLSSLHDTGGSHGFLHPDHIGLNDAGNLVIRPAFAAEIAPDPDSRASAQASDCWQMGFLLTALGLTPTMDERIGLLMAGLSRDMSIIRLQPARAIRQALSAVTARHPDWETKLLDNLGKEWGLDQLPSIEDSIIPRIYPNAPRAPVPKRSPTQAYDFKSWDSPFAEKSKSYEPKSALRDALRRNVESGRVLLPPVSPPTATSRIRLPSPEVDFDLEEEYSAKVEVKSPTVAQIKIPLAPNAASVESSPTMSNESDEAISPPPPLSVQLQSQPQMEMPSDPVAVSVDLTGPGISFSLESEEQVPDQASDESIHLDTENEVSSEETAEMTVEGDISDDVMDQAESLPQQEHEMSMETPRTDEVESASDDIPDVAHADSVVSDEASFEGLPVSITQEVALSIEETPVVEDNPVAQIPEEQSQEQPPEAPLADNEDTSPLLRLPVPVPSMAEEVEEDAIELPNEPQIASIDVNVDMLSSAADNSMIQLPEFDGQNEAQSDQPMDDLIDSYGRSTAEQPYFSASSASLQLSPEFQLPAEPEASAFEETQDPDPNVSDFVSAFDGQERVAITVRTPETNTEEPLLDENVEDSPDVGSPFESPLDELSEEESASIPDEESEDEASESERWQDEKEPEHEEPSVDKSIEESELSVSVNPRPIDPPMPSAPKVQEFLDLQDRDGDELLMRRSASQPKWMGIKGITADPARETELGSGKWTASGRSLEDLKREMPDTPVRELEIFEHDRNYSMYVFVLLILSAVAIYLLTDSADDPVSNSDVVSPE